MWDEDGDQKDDEYWDLVAEIDLDSESEDYCRSEEDGWFYQD